MNKQILYQFLVLFIVLTQQLSAQDHDASDRTSEATDLFLNQEILPLRLNYSNREVKKNSNDSTYLKTVISYMQKDGSWKKLDAKIKRRGKSRLEKCHFTPIKLKIKKSIAAGTLFEGNNKLKLVLPCLLEKDSNDNILKEFIAYKLFELVSPFHYNTRLVAIEYKENRGKKSKVHQLQGILIEEIDNIANRNNGQVIEQNVHPLNQDASSSIQNDFFQYLIGNTDYSTAYQHNQKLVYINDRIIPVPYDFDMSGLVNASYAKVSSIGDNELQITAVTQRLFRGFKRSARSFQYIRKEFLDNKVNMLNLVDKFESDFNDPREFLWVKRYIAEFFLVFGNSQKFDAKVFKMARTK